MVNLCCVLHQKSLTKEIKKQNYQLPASTVEK